VHKNKSYSSPPVNYSDAIIQNILDLDAQQKEADTAMEQMRDILGIDVLGWAPKEEYKPTKAKAREIKSKMLEAAETQDNITGIQNHFPFNGFDENS
jgi:hypothetical protein